MTAILIFPVTLVFAVATLLAGLTLRTRAPTLTMRLWAKTVLALGGIRLQRRGLANVKRGHPVIIMANHASMLDIPVLLAALPVDLRFIFKKSLLWLPLVGQVMYLVGMVPIDRFSRTKASASLRKAGNQIRKGKHILVFPEGTRSPTGTLQSFKKGGFVLAIQERIDILPVTIKNARELCGRSSILLRPGIVEVIIHPRVSPKGLDLDQRDLLLNRVRDRIASGMASPEGGQDPAFGPLVESRG